MSAFQGRFTSVDPANAGANISDPQNWNGYAYVRNSATRLIDPDGRSPTCYLDGFQTDCGAAQHMVSVGEASPCPNNACWRYDYVDDQFQQFIASAGGTSGYVDFPALGELNDWKGKFYSDTGFQRQVIAPLVDSQRRRLAKL